MGHPVQRQAHPVLRHSVLKECGEGSGVAEIDWLIVRYCCPLLLSAVVQTPESSLARCKNAKQRQQLVSSYAKAWKDATMKWDRSRGAQTATSIHESCVLHHATTRGRSGLDPLRIIRSSWRDAVSK